VQRSRQLLGETLYKVFVGLGQDDVSTYITMFGRYLGEQDVGGRSFDVGPPRLLLFPGPPCIRLCITCTILAAILVRPCTITSPLSGCAASAAVTLLTTSFQCIVAMVYVS